MTSLFSVIQNDSQMIWDNYHFLTVNEDYQTFITITLNNKSC